VAGVRRHHRPSAAAATLAAAALVAGCGSSHPTSSITVGNESANTSAAATTTTTTTTPPTQNGSGQTPTSGPLSTQPVVKSPTGPAPAKLVIKDLIVGTGAAAKSGETVSVNYVGVLYKGGAEFDASWKRRQPLTFPLGQGQVIPGWDQGVPGMKVGGRRELIIPSALAYGAQGSQGIPPNSPLVFVVDLLGIH
jgi:peptidylprolyl isomerase